MLTLLLHPQVLSIAKYSTDISLPATRGIFWSLTRTGQELSLVCDSTHLPAGAISTNDNWRAFEVLGPLDFALTGILSAIAASLAEAKISIFAVSTFDTDYVLVKAEKLERAITILRDRGYVIEVRAISVSP